MGQMPLAPVGGLSWRPLALRHALLCSPDCHKDKKRTIHADIQSSVQMLARRSAIEGTRKATGGGEVSSFREFRSGTVNAVNKGVGFVICLLSKQRALSPPAAGFEAGKGFRPMWGWGWGWGHNSVLHALQCSCGNLSLIENGVPSTMQ